MSEKITPVVPLLSDEGVKVKKDITTKLVSGNEAFAEAMIKEPPNAWSRAQFYVYAFSIVGFFCSTMNGYDSSLINNLLQNPAFKLKYSVENDGIWSGIVSSMYQIGGVAALPFVGPCIDGYGRRVGMLSGAGIIIIGTIVQGLSDGRPQFMVGRFLLGYGVCIAAAAGPMYVIEFNHPAFRGVVGAMYNTFWYSGAIIASGAARGGLNTPGDYSWRLITWLQALFSGLIVLCSLLIPESPRWLYVNNKKEEAKEILVKYHGNGNADSHWVKLQLQEYEECLSLDGADKRWWDYRALFRDRASSYRLSCNVVVSVFGQWAGNAVLSYFLGSVLETAGYDHPVQQANITLIKSCVEFLCAICGACLVDKVGRRPLLLFSLTSCTVVWLGMTVASGINAGSTSGYKEDGKPIFSNAAASQAALAMIFLFGMVYSVGITPLQALFPVEVLSFEMRAKGMAVHNLAVSAAGLLNQFAWPVSMEKIKWKTYIIFTAWDAVQVVVVYLLIPETKGRTLEELDEIFAAPNPVKASTQKKALAIDANTGEVVKVERI